MILCAIVIAGVLFDKLFLSPMDVKIRRVNREIAVKEKKLRVDLRNIRHKDFFERQYEKYKSFIEKGSSSEEENTSDMLAEIEELARLAGVNLVDIKPQTPKQIDFYKEYAAEVTVEGPMGQIMVFLYKLNNAKPPLRAVKVSLRLAQKGSSSVKATLLVTNISV